MRKREDAGEGEDEGEGEDVDEVDIPFELVGKVASAGAVAEAGHVEGLATARHDFSCGEMRIGKCLRRARS